MNRKQIYTDTMQRDLGRILAALGLGTHARSASPHQVVIREVLPAIEALKIAEPREIDSARTETAEQIELLIEEDHIYDASCRAHFARIARQHAEEVGSDE